MTPFPSPPSDLMASAMGGAGFLANATSMTSNATSSTDSSSKTKRAKKGAVVPNGAVRIFYSLKENPHAIISYADLVRQEQENRQQKSAQLLVPSKTGGTTSPLHPSSSPNIKQSTLSSAVDGQGNGSATTDSKDSTAMDIDPPEGEEDESEAEEEDDGAEDDEDDDDAEGEGEAEDEDDDEDPEEDDDEEEDSESRPREPKDFLEALTEKYANMDENGNDGEDEDEDEEGLTSKRPSRWDSEHYDIEDEFIDDSEMMLEAIGMIRPKIDGFFAFRGPVETVEDNDSSDAGQRQKKIVRRRAPASASPSSTGRGVGTKAAKASSLAIVENANDSASEASEPEEKPKPTKAPAASASAAASTVSSETTAGAASAEAGQNSTSATPTKKKAPASKGKAVTKETKDTAATKEVAKVALKDTETNRDSDKETKPTPKKPRAKSSKTSGTAAPTLDTESTKSSATAAPTPSVRIDSPPPADENTEMSTPPPSSSSPSKPKLKKSTAKAGGSDQPSTTATTALDSGMESSSSTTTKSAAKLKVAAVGDGSSAKGKSKSLEPLQKDVQALYNIVAELARKETWAVKTKFPLHIKAPLFECAKLALATGTGYVLDDNFLAHLQVVLPYNKFTLKKLIYKNILPSWITALEDQRVRLLDQFKKRVGMLSKSAGLVDRPFPTEKDNDDDVEMTEGEDRRKFPWSQDLRLLLWESMEKFMELLAVKQEFFAIDESQPPPSTESKTRKDAYQVLVQVFPLGWMTSYEISRQYSQLKEKVQKQTGREIDPSTSKIKPILAPSKYSSARGTPALPSVSRPIESPAAPARAPATLTTAAPSASALSPSKSPSAQPVPSPAHEPSQALVVPPDAPRASSAVGSTIATTLPPASVPSRKRKKVATEAESQVVALSSGEDTPMPMATDGEESGKIASETTPAVSSGGLSPSLSAANLAIYHSLLANSKKKKVDTVGAASANKVPRARKVTAPTTKTAKQKEPENGGQETPVSIVATAPTPAILQSPPASGAPSRGRKAAPSAPLVSSQGYSSQSLALQRPPSPPPPSLYHSSPTLPTLPPIHGSPYFQQQHSPSPPAHRRVASPGSSGHPMGGSYVASAVSPPRGTHPHLAMNQSLNRQQQPHGYSPQPHGSRQPQSQQPQQPQHPRQPQQQPYRQ